MRAYLTAEWGKAVARPYYRIYLAVMAALAAALALIWWWTGREGMFQGSFGECLSLLIPFFSAGIYLAVIVADAVFSDQYKAGTLKNEVSYGLPRVRIYLGKLLTAAGAGSPVVHALRLWMGGDHMVDYLPAIYQEEDFTRRFLSIFDSVFTDMDRAIDRLPGQLDYEHAGGELLRYLAQWVCVEGGDRDELVRERIRTALSDYEDLYTVEGVRRSVRRLTGREPILIEHFQVSPNRPDCKDPELYRRLYGDDPYRFFVLLPEDAFSSQRERRQFQRDMEEVIPAGMTMQMIQLKPCVQLDWHTYLGINSQVGGYVPAAIDEQVTIHYDTTIGGVDHESR